jgi:hypothetical protein
METMLVCYYTTRRKGSPKAAEADEQEEIGL